MEVQPSDVVPNEAGALTREATGSLMDHSVRVIRGAHEGADGAIAERIASVEAAQWAFEATPAAPPSLAAHHISPAIPPGVATIVAKAKNQASALWGQAVKLKSTGKGVHGAQFIIGPEGEKLGVYKAEEEKGRIDFIRQKGVFLSKGVKDPLMVGEMASHVVAEALGFVDIVPSTTVETQGDGRSGSLQAFVGGFELGPTVAKTRLASAETPTIREQTIFQRMACLDFILGNTDRHSENWMARRDAEGHISDIRLIDNGPSFPRQHVLQGTKGDSIRTTVVHNQYNWATLGAAESGFTDEMKRFIGELDEGKLNDAFQAIEAEHPGYLTQEMKDYATQRLQLLKEAAAGHVLVQDELGTRPFQLRDLFLFVDRRQCESVVPLNPGNRGHSGAPPTRLAGESISSPPDYGELSGQDEASLASDLDRGVMLAPSAETVERATTPSAETVEKSTTPSVEDMKPTEPVAPRVVTWTKQLSRFFQENRKRNVAKGRE